MSGEPDDEVTRFREGHFRLADDLVALQRVRQVGAHEATIFYAARILEVLVRSAGRAVGLRPDVSTFSGLAVLGDLGLAAWHDLAFANTLRRSGNQVRHVTGGCDGAAADVASLLLEQFLDWYFLRFRLGPQGGTGASGFERTIVAEPHALRGVIEVIRSPHLEGQTHYEAVRDATVPLPGLAGLLAERLIDAGDARAGDVLVRALAHTPDDLRLWQLRGLHASRVGDLEEALDWLSRAQRVAPDDPETVGILAGIHKRRWHADPADVEARDTALRLYRNGWKRSKHASYYLGINAATMKLLAGDPWEARSVAAEVLVALDERLRVATAHGLSLGFWDEMTRAEALLIVGRLRDGAAVYRAARALHGSRGPALEVALTQARRILEAAGLDADAVLDGPSGVDEPGPSATAFAVAVTGHRTLPDDPALRAALGDAWRLLRERAGARALRVRSALAEGADRLVVHVGREALGALPLHAALPFEVDDYRADFATEGSREEFASLLAAAERVSFPAARPTRERVEGYVDVGRRLLDGADALLAVWDGAPSRGPGGTAEVVERAASAGVAVVWVLSEAPYTVSEYRPAGNDPGVDEGRS